MTGTLEKELYNKFYPWHETEDKKGETIIRLTLLYVEKGNKESTAVLQSSVPWEEPQVIEKVHSV